MRAYNSTIKIKQKKCIVCGKDCVWFSKKRCQDCAKRQSVAESDARDEERIETESLQNIVEDLDAVVSRYVRLSNVQPNGLIKCFTCSRELPIGEMQNGHYEKRGHMGLRFDVEHNCRPQCPPCNKRHNDDPTIYRDALEKQNPGITSYLREKAREVYKFTLDEAKALLVEFRYKVKVLEKQKRKA